MKTKYDINQIIYVPFVINKISIAPKERCNAPDEAEITYLISGKGAARGTTITSDEKEFYSGWLPVKTAEDFSTTIVDQPSAVEAIPISWILKHERMPQEGKVHDAIMDMIDNWRRENKE